MVDVYGKMLEFAVKMHGKSDPKDILPKFDGFFMVIYHGTIRKKNHQQKQIQEKEAHHFD